MSSRIAARPHALPGTEESTSPTPQGAPATAAAPTRQAVTPRAPSRPLVNAAATAQMAPADGASQRAFSAGAPVPAGAVRAGSHSLASLRETLDGLKKTTSSYLAIAGITTPPHAEGLEARVEKVVAKARANKASGAVASFDGTHGAVLAKSVLGLNTGDDRIEEARVRYEAPFVRLDAYDHKGFHVVAGIVNIDLFHPTDVHITGLKASHGRNCDDFDYSAGRAKMPGRGNALAVAAGLEAIIEQAVAAGASRLSTLPGSDQVADLYARMGFTSGALTGNRGGRPMTLDLTSKRTVRKALVIFSLGRANVKDVPKNVAERMRASGDPAPVPQAAEQRPSDAGVKVLRADAGD